LALTRYQCAAGARDSRLVFLQTDLLAIPRAALARACMRVFKNPYFPTRGIVDDERVALSIRTIANGLEYLILERRRRARGVSRRTIMPPETRHTSLEEDLLSLLGVPVIVGHCPDMYAGPDEAVDGIVPCEDGRVRAGLF